MKWNTPGKFQTSRKGSARAHLYYFVTQHGTGSQEWQAGYYGFNRQITFTDDLRPILFPTAKEARDYCESLDRSALVIEAVTA